MRIRSSANSLKWESLKCDSLKCESLKREFGQVRTTQEEYYFYVDSRRKDQNTDIFNLFRIKRNLMFTNTNSVVANKSFRMLKKFFEFSSLYKTDI